MVLNFKMLTIKLFIVAGSRSADFPVIRKKKYFPGGPLYFLPFLPSLPSGKGEKFYLIEI